MLYGHFLSERNKFKKNDNPFILIIILTVSKVATKIITDCIVTEFVFETFFTIWMEFKEIFVSKQKLNTNESISYQ